MGTFLHSHRARPWSQVRIILRSEKLNAFAIGKLQASLSTPLSFLILPSIFYKKYNTQDCATLEFQNEDHCGFAWLDFGVTSSIRSYNARFFLKKKRIVVRRQFESTRVHTVSHVWGLRFPWAVRILMYS